MGSLTVEVSSPPTSDYTRTDSQIARTQGRNLKTGEAQLTGFYNEEHRFQYNVIKNY